MRYKVLQYITMDLDRSDTPQSISLGEVEFFEDMEAAFEFAKEHSKDRTPEGIVETVRIEEVSE